MTRYRFFVVFITGIFIIVIFTSTSADNTQDSSIQKAKSLTEKQLNNRTVTIEFKLSGGKKHVTDSEYKAIRRIILKALNKRYRRPKFEPKRRRRDVPLGETHFADEDLGFVDTPNLDGIAYTTLYGISDKNEILSDMLLEVINETKAELEAAVGLDILTSYAGLPNQPVGDGGESMKKPIGYKYKPTGLPKQPNQPEDNGERTEGVSLILKVLLPLLIILLILLLLGFFLFYWCKRKAQNRRSTGQASNKAQTDIPVREKDSQVNHPSLPCSISSAGTPVRVIKDEDGFIAPLNQLESLQA